MARYRTKPTEVQAFKVSELLGCQRNHLPAVVREAGVAGMVVLRLDGILIRRLDGYIRADRSDWIIIERDGEIRPCRADIIEQEYEPISKTPEFMTGGDGAPMSEIWQYVGTKARTDSTFYHFWKATNAGWIGMESALVQLLKALKKDRDNFRNQVLSHLQRCPGAYKEICFRPPSS